jgi:murein DD-endopeptidase MepM/ murein hydrolase activator NlpD
VRQPPIPRQMSNRQPHQWRWMWVALLGLMALITAMERPAGARPLTQAPVLSPEAVTTPAPTPTPTPFGTVTAATPAASHWQTYTVQAGDTLLSVALETGIDVADMPCVIAPTFTGEQPLVIGNVLEIPPPGTLCHAVQPGETIESIAARYRVHPEMVAGLAWNRLAGWPPHLPLAANIHLRVPLAIEPSLTVRDGATGLASAEEFLTYMLQQPVNTSPFVAYAVGGGARATSAAGQVPSTWPYGSGHFAWPLFGWLTQGYRYDHRAIDVAAPSGTLVTAADRGVVIRAGWNNQGYGQFVVIDHNIDYITLYAHLSEVMVEEGQVVAQGQAVGRVGSTGNSTGPHLHFEIRDFGRLTNPLEFLGK